MARRLLVLDPVWYREPEMRWWVPSILPLLGLNGCLYIGGINHPPEGEIEVEAGSALLALHGTVTLKAVSADQDDDRLSQRWSVTLTNLDGRQMELTQMDGPDNLRERGTEGPPPVLWTGSQLTLTTLPERGTYQVYLAIQDEDGAETRVQTAFEVKNQPPVLSVQLDVDPDFQQSDRVPDLGFPGGEARYPGHAHYQAWLMEDDLSANYLEDDLRCGKGATVEWLIKGPASDQVEYQTVQPCEGNERLDRFRFRLKPGAITAPTRITVEAVVDDGYPGGTATAAGELELAPNRPPCIIGTDPAFLALSQSVEANKVVVYHDRPATFEVTSLSEDVNDGLVYSWWLQESPGSGFAPLAEGVAGRSFTMPAWFRPPGTEVLLRVGIQEAGGPAPGCSPDQVLCRSDADRLPESCYQWVTWRVKFVG